MVTKPKKKRRRRTPEEAQAEILDAAENLLLSGGPNDLTFSAIASKVGLAKSNVHHHFGSLSDLKASLIKRMIERLAIEVVTAISAVDATDPRERTKQGIKAIYSVIATEDAAKLIAWLVLFYDGSEDPKIFEMMGGLQDLAVNILKDFMSKPEAEKAAPHILYQIAITAVGEGLLGGVLKDVIKSDVDLGGMPKLVEMTASYWE